MNISKKQNMSHLFIALILLTLYIFISAFSYVNAISQDISNSVFRLHIIANSDSSEDQNLKLKVRDSVLKYMNKISNYSNSKEEIINLTLNHKNNFKKIAENTIKENGYNYPVDIDICNSYFPTKTYGDLSFPAGMYDCLKIKIGKANGKNWWCVMFPPLCFVDVSTGIVPDESKNQIKKDLNDEEFNLICNNNTVTLKFKIIELFQNFKVGKFN